MLSTQDILVVAGIVVVLFGAKKIPELAKGVGEGIRNFKKAVNEPDEVDVTPKKPVESDKPEEKK
ncbi:MAG TPA: twin-arginine translocase TatA/TatE family subunit [Dissulfurispiraceae bacterium]|nr:twin-arginine translocase TatA/TatE family subunit [Dissulfurispiraceae bacterium]